MSGSKIAMPLSATARLVAGHVHILWRQWANENLGGCCPTCCAACSALKELLDVGLLDVLYGVYVEESDAEDSAIWDDILQEVDRKWLLSAWNANLDCHEEADT